MFEQTPPLLETLWEAMKKPQIWQYVRQKSVCGRANRHYRHISTRFYSVRLYF